MSQQFDPKRLSKLTDGQRKVLEALHRLDGIAAVAREMDTSPKTIDNHLREAKIRLGLEGVSSHRAAWLFHECTTANRPNSKAEQPEPTESENAPSPTSQTFGRPPAGLTILGRSRHLPPTALRALALVSFAAFNLAGIGWVRPAQPADFLSEAKTSNMSLAQLDSSLRRASEPGLISQNDRQWLTEELMKRAWAGMWTAREDAVLAVINGNASVVRAAIQQAFLTNPDAAAEMLGDGHRLLARSKAFPDWTALIDRAERRAINRQSIEFGRLSLGIALANWKIDAIRGYRAAELALGIFQSLPGTDLDQANALRHMGLCAVRGEVPGLRQEDGLALYDRAMAIYLRLCDTPGIAETRLSYAQQGTGGLISPDRWARNALFATESLKQFCDIGNLNCASEAFHEIIQDTDVLLLKSKMTSCVQSELTTVHRYAEFARLSGDRTAASEAYGFCISQAPIANSSESALADTERLLALCDARDSLTPAARCLAGLYRKECTVSGRKAARLPFDPCRDWDEACSQGYASSPSALEDYACRFQVQFEHP